MKYRNNKSIQISFMIRENLYYRFRTLCKAENNMPSKQLQELINNYVVEKEKIDEKKNNID